MKLTIRACVPFVSTAGSAVSAAQATVQVQRLELQGGEDVVGTVTLRDTEFGLTPGVHGFHVHANPDCGAADKGGKMVGQHEGPVGHGHLGDLPVLVVDRDGNAAMPVFARRLKTSDVVGHSVMIHAGGDDYSDDPKPLGGGGARVARGVIEAGGATPEASGH